GSGPASGVRRRWYRWGRLALSCGYYPPNKRESGSGDRVAAALAPAEDVFAYPGTDFEVGLFFAVPDLQCRNGCGPAVCTDCYEVHVTDGAQSPLAAQRVLAEHLAADDHAAAPGPHDPAPDLDDVTD